MTHPTDTQLSPGESDQERTVKTIGLVKLILERFPHVQAISLQLLMQHPAFRELCEEYETCDRTAEQLAKTEPDSGVLKEYKALRLRIEGELLSYLSQHGTPR